MTGHLLAAAAVSDSPSWLWYATRGLGTATLIVLTASWSSASSRPRAGWGRDAGIRRSRRPPEPEPAFDISSRRAHGDDGSRSVCAHQRPRRADSGGRRVPADLVGPRSRVDVDSRGAGGDQPVARPNRPASMEADPLGRLRFVAAGRDPRFGHRQRCAIAVADRRCRLLHCGRPVRARLPAPPGADVDTSDSGRRDGRGSGEPGGGRRVGIYRTVPAGLGRQGRHPIAENSCRCRDSRPGAPGPRGF